MLEDVWNAVTGVDMVCFELGLLAVVSVALSVASVVVGVRWERSFAVGAVLLGVAPLLASGPLYALRIAEGDEIIATSAPEDRARLTVESRRYALPRLVVGIGPALVTLPAAGLAVWRATRRSRRGAVPK